MVGFVSLPAGAPTCATRPSASRSHHRSCARPTPEDAPGAVFRARGAACRRRGLSTGLSDLRDASSAVVGMLAEEVGKRRVELLSAALASENRLGSPVLEDDVIAQPTRLLMGVSVARDAANSPV